MSSNHELHHHLDVCWRRPWDRNMTDSPRLKTFTRSHSSSGAGSELIVQEHVNVARQSSSAVESRLSPASPYTSTWLYERGQGYKRGPYCINGSIRLNEEAYICRAIDEALCFPQRRVVLERSSG